MKCCKVCEALELAIKKCDIQIDELESGHNPLSIKNEDIENLLEERHEYLTGLRSKLDFLLNNNDRMEMKI